MVKSPVEHTLTIESRDGVARSMAMLLRLEGKDSGVMRLSLKSQRSSGSSLPPSCSQLIADYIPPKSVDVNLLLRDIEKLLATRP